MTLSKKGKIAKNKLNAINGRVGKLIKILKTTNERLVEIIQDNQIKELARERCVIKDSPDRIMFEKNHLTFYIDFTIVCQESENPSSIKGSIIYGISRKQCLAKCLSKDDEKECQRNKRCDHLEDKPLIDYTVDEDGLIKSSGSLEDEWWVKCDNNKKNTEERYDNLEDLHFCTLVHIWKDALDWSNENLLP